MQLKNKDLTLVRAARSYSMRRSASNEIYEDNGLSGGISTGAARKRASES
jgi:hypothetical protein